jgi:ABC-type polysaccharide/polyol phosphate export permease
MSSVTRTTPAFIEDLRKLPAFFRREFLTLWSYRLGFVSDWFNLAIQIAILVFVSRLIDAEALPEVGGVHPTYVEFAAVGIAVSSLLQANLARTVSATRGEQLMGTLETLFLTPTAPTTVLVGAVVYDMVYVPIRTVLLLGILSLLAEVRFELSGLVAVLPILVVFLPFLWGLSWIGAAGVLTYRRGSGVVGIVGALLVFTSGAYFPTDLLPPALEWVADHNPITIAVDATREALLAGAPAWADVWRDVLAIAPAAVASLIAGSLAVRWALRRERRLGTLGTY